MIDISIQNFQTELIEASLQQPVLLDIWAPWCGPCKQLGPVLEKLENEYQGRFILAKLNSDEQPDIAGQLSQMFGVRSIPFCVMFVQGQPVDGFVGAIPEAQIREFLSKYVPSESELAAESDLVEAEQALSEGHADQAQSRLEAALQTDPNNDNARFELLQLLINAGQLDQAAAIFAPLAPRTTGPLAEARPSAWGRYLEAAQWAAQQNPDIVAQLQTAISANKRDFAARHQLAQWHFAHGEFTAAMDELLEIIMRDKAWNDELARKTYVAILEVMTKPTPKANTASSAEPKSTLEVAGAIQVAQGDPVIDQYRRKLSMALF